MKFDIAGQGDNFLMVTLARGEEIQCEADAMVMMEGPLDLEPGVKGGFFSGVMRKFTNGESFFTESIKATRGDGETLLSPTLPGDIQVLDVAPGREYYLNDGCFLACESTVNVTARSQSLGRAVFGGTGGLFVGHATGRGKLAVSGFGTVLEMGIDTTPDNPVTIDNMHVVAWDAGLKYELSTSTSRSAGFLRGIINSVLSGEGVVLKFHGKGTVVICSRNRNAFVSWLGSLLTPSK